MVYFNYVNCGFLIHFNKIVIFIDIFNGCVMFNVAACPLMAGR